MMARTRALSIQKVRDGAAGDLRAFDPDRASPVCDVGCIPSRSAWRRPKNPLRANFVLRRYFKVIWVVQSSPRK
jgi:hypothetical protein